MGKRDQGETPMKTTALLAALCALACAPALAQPAPSAVTPSQIDAAEKAFQARARAAFRTIARTPAQRLAVVQGARAGATAADLGATVTLTPRTPWASDKAWLNATLAIIDAQEDYMSMLAYPDEFAPQGAIDVVIKTAPGKRYLVECSALTLGSSSARATVYSGDSAAAAQQLTQDSTTTSAPGSAVSVVTPASTAPYLRVTLDVARNSIGAAGMAVLALDKCEVTPFS